MKVKSVTQFKEHDGTLRKPNQIFETNNKKLVELGYCIILNELIKNPRRNYATKKILAEKSITTTEEVIQD